MKPNADKSHLLILNNQIQALVKLGEETIASSPSIGRLGVKIDENLNFTEHITKLCKKLHVLARISKFLSKDKLRILLTTFMISQFNYCPLAWMFHNRTLNNKINRLHERSLRLVYEGKTLSFQELLDLDNSMTIHHRNIQKLATEMFKIKNKLSPTPMIDIFREYVNVYDLRSKRC